MKNLFIITFALSTFFISTLGFCEYDPNPKECTKGATALEPAAGENVVVGINSDNAVNVSNDSGGSKSSSLTSSAEKKDDKPKKK